MCYNVNLSYLSIYLHHFFLLSFHELLRCGSGFICCYSNKDPGITCTLLNALTEISVTIPSVLEYLSYMVFGKNLDKEKSMIKLRIM